MRKILKHMSIAAAVFSLMFVLTGCGGSKGELRILSGSENQELEAILEKCEKETGVDIQMTYQGSVDIMRTLKEGGGGYDAVWPASSIWISMGDEQHKVKYAESISTTPVVFGIRKSLAEELGFTQKDVSVKDILAAIDEGKLKFCMTSATQSNSGASAYIGFLNAFLDKEGVITQEDLEDQQMQDELRKFFSGVERSSGSSDWLKEMFLESDYDAMVNYECLIISANKTLTERGEEPLYVVYPYDGLSIADSPLGYLDHGDQEKEEAFLAVQEYLLSEEAQSDIEATGRRTGYGGVSEENKEVFNSDWGIDVDRILSPIPMPDAPVLLAALNLYQTELRKPSLTVYCLDYSGSMYGEGMEQLLDAMYLILDQEEAGQYLLQASSREVDAAVLFDDTVLDMKEVKEPTSEDLMKLYDWISDYPMGGGTDIYNAAIEGLNILRQYDLSEYTPAIILMTDGQSNGMSDFDDFKAAYDAAGLDVPVFSIMFGNAEESQLEELAEYSNGRVFDGRDDLVGAFRSVKGYN
ncbi:MAG TPA: VWA domain-containing protein [Candidatus Lachnoclostridium stercoravium]|uniref:VWA domain-containing protein n=1 Tax=Candidatus Lachnoclostridium stercoravium TaxID=2838633 RepID=A0A9D2KMG6_9FIRM|nr:VWA domain-containing protein [Candidatus Lachnoclostridium stercoravium]